MHFHDDSQHGEKYFWYFAIGGHFWPSRRARAGMNPLPVLSLKL